jgi:hypothetical protein
MAPGLPCFERTQINLKGIELQVICDQQYIRTSTSPLYHLSLNHHLQVTSIWPLIDEVASNTDGDRR